MELKQEAGKLTMEQLRWAAALGQWYLIRPSTLPYAEAVLA
jgi:hypothetical protein